MKVIDAHTFFIRGTNGNLLVDTDYIPIRKEALVIACEQSRKFLDSMGINGEINSTPNIAAIATH